MNPEKAWRPSASRQAIQARADLQALIRQFFQERQVLEVETPVLGRAGVTDVNLVNVVTQLQGQGLPEPTDYYFQTSPEYAMKRLLAAGIGDCFQLCKVVRNEELSARHNFEFTLLEWYRLGFDDRQLMAEVEALFQYVFAIEQVQYISYQEAFQAAVGVDPLVATATEVCQALEQRGIDAAIVQDDKLALFDLAMGTLVEPSFGKDTLTFVYHFPAEQAVLARLHQDDPRVAHRFEVFYQGLELGNGFWELQDAQEQHQRFVADNETRERLGYPVIPIDHRLIQALDAGLPDCAGIAVGVDRLLMILLQTSRIEDVLTFPSLLA